MNKEQINLMIESLEELNEELSVQSKGTLFSEQWDLLEYLKKQLILSGVGTSLDLVELEKKIDKALDTETSESLKEWLHSKRL
jgi:hypothetical protein